MTAVTVVGDTLLDRDVVGTAERLMPGAAAPVLDESTTRTRPGGAGLAALLAARDGHRTTLITALSRDPAGRELQVLLDRAGVEVVDLGCAVATSEKIRLRVATGGARDGVADRSLLRWDRGARATADDVGPWTPAATRALRDADAVLVACYGRGTTRRDDARDALAAAAARTPVVWDPHPRGGSPVPGTAVATPNADEARGFVPSIPGDGLDAAIRRAEAMVDVWRVRACAVTLGGRGAVLSTGDGLPLVVPARPAAAVDTCGAGDRFAATLAGRLADGHVPSTALAAAVDAATTFVAAGGAGAVTADGPAPTAPPAEDAAGLCERVRAAGGTVVATGGCFDLVHSGHARVLQAARALGDCLVVCVNSDASVRRLKGPGRPIVGQADRVALLEAFDAVDAVVTFDDDTPAGVLQALRPHVFAKGGDYAGQHIPESDVLAAWGGRAVTLPYTDGRSTTRLIQEVTRHATR